MNLKKEPCNCLSTEERASGRKCRKFYVKPIIVCQEGTVDETTADLLMEELSNYVVANAKTPDEMYYAGPTDKWTFHRSEAEVFATRSCAWVRIAALNATFAKYHIGSLKPVLFEKAAQ